MTQPYKFPFVLDLFDGEADNENDGADDNNDDAENEPQRQPKRGNGKFVPADNDVNVRLYKAEQALKERNKENQTRREENKRLNDGLAQTQSQMKAYAEKTKRSEAKAALADAGVIHSDVVDVFLRKAGDKVKVDDSFEVIGVDEALADFKASHPMFFKAAVQAAANEQNDDAEESEEPEDPKPKAKPNATARGASLNGAAARNRGTKVTVNDNASASDLLAMALRNA